MLQDPGRIEQTSPSRSPRCCPRTQQNEGSSSDMISWPNEGFSTRCLRFTNRVAAAHARLTSGWLACSGRESNPLDCCERFLCCLTSLSPFQALSRRMRGASPTTSMLSMHQPLQLKRSDASTHYALEEEVRGKDAGLRRSVRQTRARPPVDDLRSWL